MLHISFGFMLLILINILGGSFHTTSINTEALVVASKEIQCANFVTRYVSYGEELLAPRPTPKLEDQALSAVRDCLFNIFAATFHIGGRSSIRD